MREENFVGCLLLIVFLAFPRIALAWLFLFSNYLERAYHGLILPLLGFLLTPNHVSVCVDGKYTPTDRWH